MEWQWAQEGELTKLLGSPFGLDISSQELDEFLIKRIEKKLTYWISVHLSFSGRVTIINQVLLSSLWYFVSVWAGSSKIFGKIVILLQNFLWTGKNHQAKVRVNWFDCCAKRSVGGLSILNPQEALTTLLSKWVVNAFLPGKSNLQILLMLKLKQMSPNKMSHWPNDTRWCFVGKHNSVPGSKVWGAIQTAWNQMVKCLIPGRPLYHSDTASLSLWWSTHFHGGNHNISQKL
jgi:hypothetical protein